VNDDLLGAVLAAPARLVRVDGRAYLDGQDVTQAVVWALTSELLEAGTGGLKLTALGEMQVAATDAGRVLAGVGG
jgi:hypothetical protein